MWDKSTSNIGNEANGLIKSKRHLAKGKQVKPQIRELLAQGQFTERLHWASSLRSLWLLASGGVCLAVGGAPCPFPRSFQGHRLHVGLPSKTTAKRGVQKSYLWIISNDLHVPLHSPLKSALCLYWPQGFRHRLILPKY